MIDWSHTRSVPDSPSPHVENPLKTVEKFESDWALWGQIVKGIVAVFMGVVRDPVFGNFML
jgi:hypothetical protein